MPDPVLIRDFTLQIPLPADATFEQVKDAAAEQINDAYFSMAGPYDRNWIAPLLQTSYQLRDIALTVLSRALCIPRPNER